MKERNQSYDPKKVDAKEFEIPETLFVRDIENHVFQGIVAESLGKISGISLADDNFIDTLLKSPSNPLKGIHAEQDPKTNTIKIKIELNVQFGVSIPEKSEEIQTKVTEEITKLTGLHVSVVHLIFKSIFQETITKKSIAKEVESRALRAQSVEEDYNDEF